MKQVLVAILALSLSGVELMSNVALAIKAPPRPKSEAQAKEQKSDAEESHKSEQQLLIERISGVVPDEAAKAEENVPTAKKRGKIDYSGSVAFTSEYVFRGISLSDEDFAVQGTLNALTPGGYYLGGFGSNVDFNDGDRTIAELDFYTGRLGKFTDRLGYNIDFTYSTFQGAPSRFNFDNVELGGFLEYSISRFFIHGGVAFSPDYFRNSGTSIYYDGNVDVSLPMDFTLKLHAGFQEIEKNSKFGSDDYTDWLIGIQKDIQGFNASVSYTDTDLTREECFDGGDVCDSRFVFLLGRGL